MKFYFEDKKLFELYQSGNGKYPNEVIISFFRKMRTIIQMKDERELLLIRGNNFEKMKGFENLYSIRLNDKYRMEFSIERDGGIRILNIKKISNHYS